jgi:hypothetical protein
VNERRRVVWSAASATVALGVLLGIGPLPVERILAGYVLVLAAIALASLTRAAQPAEELGHAGSRFLRALRPRREKPLRPPELVRTERDLTLGVAGAGHAFTRLLPLLREAAAVRLATKYGVDLERRPAEAEALLGTEAWALLRPDLPAPADRNAAGVPLARVEWLVTRLEQL